MLTGKHLGTAIERARQKKRVTKTALAAAMGVKPTSVQDWVKYGRIAKERINDLVSYFSDVVGPEHWGLAFKEFEKRPEHAVPARTADIPIHQFDAAGSMDHGITLHDQPGLIQMLGVSREWLEKNVRAPFSSPTDLCIVTGFGDSMQPMFNAGDPLLMDRRIRRMDFDGTYFFRIGDEAFIRRLQRIPDVGIVAISENKAYEKWNITPDMDFEIFGRILKVWRSQDM